MDIKEKFSQHLDKNNEELWKRIIGQKLRKEYEGYLGLAIALGSGRDTREEQLKILTDRAAGVFDDEGLRKRLIRMYVEQIDIILDNINADPDLKKMLEQSNGYVKNRQEYLKEPSKAKRAFRMVKAIPAAVKQVNFVEASMKKLYDEPRVR